MDVRPLLDAIERERDIAGDLLDESERLITLVLRLTAHPVMQARLVAHLTGLRTFLGGGFNFDTKES